MCCFFTVCPGTDLNRYSRCGEQDFKSCVSTNSTTRAPKKILPCRRKFRAEDRARTGHPDLGKVVLYQMSYFRFLKNFIYFLSGCKYKELLQLQPKVFLNYLYFGVYCVLSGTLAFTGSNFSA